MAVMHLVMKPRTARGPGVTLCGMKLLLPVVGASDMGEVTCRKCLAKAESKEAQQLLLPKYGAGRRKLNTAIGKRIRRFRKENRLSQVELGALLGRAQTWVSSLELGVYHIDLPLLAALEHILERPIESFLPKRKSGMFVISD